MAKIFPHGRARPSQEMAPAPTYDFLVVGGFHAPDDHAKLRPIAAANASFLSEQDSERLLASVTSALKQGRNLVRRTDGRNPDDRSLLADALEAAVRDGDQDGEGQPKGARAMVLVGFGAGGESQCDEFLSDERLKSCARHFAARGGVVLVQGRGGAIDVISRHWFEKTWTSGLKRGAERSWRYNSDSAWGGGYFARWQDVASSARGEPSLRKEVRFGVVYEVERVKPVDAMYLSVPHKDDVDKTDEGDKQPPVIGYRNGGVTLGATCAVALGAFGGGHVGCIGAGEDQQETTLRVIQGLCEAAPGVGTPDALKRLKKSGLKGFNSRSVAAGGEGKVEVAEPPSMTKFAAFAVFAVVVSIMVMVYLVKLVIRSNM